MKASARLKMRKNRSIKCFLFSSSVVYSNLRTGMGAINTRDMIQHCVSCLLPRSEVSRVDEVQCSRQRTGSPHHSPISTPSSSQRHHCDRPYRPSPKSYRPLVYYSHQVVVQARIQWRRHGNKGPVGQSLSCFFFARSWAD